MTCRVRFAPSPTGPLHMGGVRTALFNYLFARANNGTMILRIEDTDQNRYVAGAEDYIMESLSWCGIEIDEGLREGGDFGPYRQSERKDIYHQYADELINSGWAYYAFDTPEELEEERKKAEVKSKENDPGQKGGKFSYDAATRLNLRNSLSLSTEEVNKLIKSGQPYVIRFKFPEQEEVFMHDLVRGDVVVSTNTLDDKVLFKSDGMPTYHLANVVDDHLMKISHVIRGEEWLPSLPLHVMLYKAFQWTDTMPQFAHLPLILKPSGNGKLSKRDGDKLGFPVFPIEYKNHETGEISSGYRESGYLPDAFINMIALLGWNPGTEQEVFSMDELVKSFSLERVGKSGSRFDPDKSRSLNHSYIQQKSNGELLELIKAGTKGRGDEGNEINKEKVLGIVKERMHLLTDFWDQSYFFFQAPTEYDAKMVKKGWKEQTAQRMKEVSQIIEGSALKAEELEVSIKEWIEKNELGMGMVMNPLRLALVGAPKGPGVFDIIEILGKEETIKRINQAISTLG